MSNQFPSFGDNESESGDDWNPLPAVASDDEEQPEARPSSGSKAPRRAPPVEPKDEEDDEKPDLEAPSPRKAQDLGNEEDAEEDAEGAGNDENLNGDRDDEEDEEDEEEDEEEEVTGHRRKRHKRDRRNQFLDVEAEVEDEDEEAEEEDDEMPGEGFLADTHPDDEGLPAGDEGDDRRHRELDRRRQQQEDLDAEKAAAVLKERYGRNRATKSDSAIVPQRLLLPSVDDPTIWGVRCKPGKEREVVFSIVKRIEERATSREPLVISAAFERGGTMTGFVYVEARKQADVMVACEGIFNLYPRTKMVLVPINEMPDLLRTTKTKSLEPGMYVRIKRGKYQGDLAQIDEVEMNGLEVELRIVPRLDYGLNEDANAPMISNGAHGEAAKRKRQGNLGAKFSQRPPQRLFSEVEARKRHSRYIQTVSSYNKKQFVYQGDTYKAGFLHKTLKIQLLQTENVNPTLEEVTKFTAGAEDGTENLDLTALAATLKAGNGASSYLPGDMVEIYHGEQRGVSGKAVTVHGDIVTLRVVEGELRGQTIEAPVKGLRKKFGEGDHVKVVGGSKYQDEVGMVVRIKDDRVTLLSDSNNQELTVFSKDLRAATDSGPAGVGSKYDLYDLVQLDPSTVAVVVKVDRESLKVLDQLGEVRTLLPSQISNKLERRRFAVATDKDGTEVRNDDTVKEVAGEQRSGSILHIHRVYLFLQNRQQTENSGVFVVRNSAVVTVAAKGGRIVGPDLTKMNPAMQRGGAAPSGGMAPPKSYGRDRLLGKTITIRKGPYKGLLGIVKDTTDAEARIELHTKNKVITVSKDVISIKDPITGATIDGGKFSRGGAGAPFAGPRPGYGGATPSRGADAWDGGRTPAFGAGGKTPAWGAQAVISSNANASRTPGWKQPAAGGRTPAPGWADGSRTSNPYADGSRTAYGGATAYGGTSTWNPNASTPYHTSSGFSANANTGSRTPAAWEATSSSRTPAHRGFDAPTPGFSAATPGAAYSAPTPGADAYGGGNHPTPRGANPYGAPTPGAFSADTPGVYGSAATPGAVGGEDDGYE